MFEGGLQTAKTVARRAGLGKILLYSVHRPLGLMRKSCLEGGPLEQRRTEQARLQMVEAARSLPSLSLPPIGQNFEVHFLTGAKYWYQTLFCAWSMQLHANAVIKPVLYDDGTLSDELVTQFRDVMPSTALVPYAEITERLEDALPASKYPELRARRLTYPHLRKLTDVHAGRSGWSLVLDSDMLFFREPRFVLDWLKEPTRRCHMLDVEESYGYPIELMNRLAGKPVLRMVNVGMCGFKSETIDWDRLEYWCRSLVAAGKMQYLLEQALTAMLLSQSECSAAPKADYRVKPDLAEGRTPTAVLHHYVAESKRSYFQFGWRHVLEQISNHIEVA